MTVQTVNVTPTIEWDDGLVFVFSFPGPGADAGRVFCGIIHLVTAASVSSGQQVQINPLVQLINSNMFQGSNDPQTWIETVKTCFRDHSKPLTVVFDDAVSAIYTTLTIQSFTLQLLHSLTG